MGDGSNRNSKSEYRNPKQFKILIFKILNFFCLGNWNFEHLHLFRILCFVFETWHNLILNERIGNMEPDGILQRLPHAFPFRMIDRILEIEPGKKAMALKNVSIDEPYFSGHFPNDPIMPTFLILEALAQTGGLPFHSSFEKEEGFPILARIDEFRLKRKVIPGDQIILEAEILQVFSHLAKVKVFARVGEEALAEGIFVLAKGSSE
jgi:3-hydroxyacyl-[acyl-carrier-protein] dehydratase